MTNLPPGWDFDYDGTRWFYRYRPTGLVQYHFPREGDEFPEFVADDGAAGGPAPQLAPEERLESQHQVRRLGSQGRKNKNKRDDGDRLRARMSATAVRPVSSHWEEGGASSSSPAAAEAVFQPESFMFLGPGTYADISPLMEEEEEEAAKRTLAGAEEGGGSSEGALAAGEEESSGAVDAGVVKPAGVVDAGIVEAGAVEPGPVEDAGTGDAGPAPAAAVQDEEAETIHLIDGRELPAELPAPERFDPVGVLPEMATSNTGLSRSETHPDPVEMSDGRMLAPIETEPRPGYAELPETCVTAEKQDAGEKQHAKPGRRDELLRGAVAAASRAREEGDRTEASRFRVPRKPAASEAKFQPYKPTDDAESSGEGKQAAAKTANRRSMPSAPRRDPSLSMGIRPGGGQVGLAPDSVPSPLAPGPRDRVAIQREQLPNDSGLSSEKLAPVEKKQEFVATPLALRPAGNGQNRHSIQGPLTSSHILDGRSEASGGGDAGSTGGVNTAYRFPSVLKPARTRADLRPAASVSSGEGTGTSTGGGEAQGESAMQHGVAAGSDPDKTQPLAELPLGSGSEKAPAPRPQDAIRSPPPSARRESDTAPTGGSPRHLRSRSASVAAQDQTSSPVNRARRGSSIVSLSQSLDGESPFTPSPDAQTPPSAAQSAASLSSSRPSGLRHSISGSPHEQSSAPPIPRKVPLDEDPGSYFPAQGTPPKEGGAAPPPTVPPKESLQQQRASDSSEETSQPDPVQESSIPGYALSRIEEHDEEHAAGTDALEVPSKGVVSRNKSLSGSSSLKQSPGMRAQSPAVSVVSSISIPGTDQPARTSPPQQGPIQPHDPMQGQGQIHPPPPPPPPGYLIPGQPAAPWPAQPWNPHAQPGFMQAPPPGWNPHQNALQPLRPGSAPPPPKGEKKWTKWFRSSKSTKQEKSPGWVPAAAHHPAPTSQQASTPVAWAPHAYGQVNVAPQGQIPPGQMNATPQNTPWQPTPAGTPAQWAPPPGPPPPSSSSSILRADTGGSGSTAGTTPAGSIAGDRRSVDSQQHAKPPPAPATAGSHERTASASSGLHAQYPAPQQFPGSPAMIPAPLFSNGASGPAVGAAVPTQGGVPARSDRWA